MLQMSTPLLQNHVDSRLKTNIFASRQRQKSLCFDEKHANFRVKHTNS